MGIVKSGLDERPSLQFVSAQPIRHFGPAHQLVPVHGEISANIDLDTATVRGTVSWRLSQTVVGACVLALDAVDFDEIDASCTDASAFSKTYDGKQLTLKWEKDAVLDGCVVTISWTVKRPRAGMYFLGSPSNRAKPPFEGVFTDHETERARYWLPCADHPSIRTTVTLEISTASRFAHLGPGMKVSDVVDKTCRTTSWSLDAPCPAYLLCLAIGKFNVANMCTKAGLSLNTYGFSPISSETLRQYFGPTVEMMDWMTHRLDVAFPYPKYWQFVAPGVGGAMENISLTSWDEALIGNDVDHSEFGWIVDIINLHEMAHSYFGDLVVIRDYAHAWLKEGWATYMESVWLEETSSPEDGQLFLYEDRLNYLDEVSSRYTRPIVTRYFDHSWHIFDRHLYQGSALRIHMLRKKLGETPFWAGVKLYLDTYAGQVAETDDFRRCLETTSGSHLSRFFEDWFRRDGCPTLVVSENEGTSGYAVNLRQKPIKEGEEPFELAICVAAQDANGNWHYRTTDLSRGESTVAFDFCGRPKQVVIDPLGEALYVLDSSIEFSMYLAMAKDCKHTLGRIQAAEQLVKNGSKIALKALDAAYRAESHFGARRVIVKLCTNEASGATKSLLLRWLKGEADPKVKSLIANGLRNELLDANDVEMVRGYALSEEEGSRTRSALLECLGRQGAEEDTQALMNLALSENASAVLRMGALSGLSRMGSQSAWQLIDRYYRDLAGSIYLSRVRHRALVTASMALPSEYRYQTLRQLETVCDSVNGREACQLAAALVELNHPEGLRLMSRLAQSIDHQSGSDVERHIRTLADKQKSKSTTQGMAELESRVRKLERQISEPR